MTKYKEALNIIKKECTEYDDHVLPITPRAEAAFEKLQELVDLIDKGIEVSIVVKDGRVTDAYSSFPSIELNVLNHNSSNTLNDNEE